MTGAGRLEANVDRVGGCGDPWQTAAMRILTVAIFLLASLALPVHAGEAPVLAWTVAADGAVSSFWLDEHGELSREGLWMVGQGQLVQVIGAQSSYALCDCDAWMDSGMQGDCKPSGTRQTDVSLVQLGPGGSKGTHAPAVAIAPAISGDEALDLAEYGAAVWIRGSAGPWLFVEGESWMFGCGAAHPSAGAAQWMWHVGDGRRYEVFGGLVQDEETRRLAELGKATATGLLSAREMADEVDAAPVALRPGWQGGALSLDVLWSSFACYACGDGLWGSYSISATLPAGLVPKKLAPYATLPERVAAFLSAHPELSLGGWTPAPAGERDRFATPKFRYPMPPSPVAPRASLERPVDAVFGYYGALDARRPDDAFVRFAFPGWDRAKWDRAIWSGAGCARVNQATLVHVDVDDARVQADLCVEDGKAGTVDRWTGAIGVVRGDHGWAMSEWELSKSGSCKPGCVP